MTTRTPADIVALYSQAGKKKAGRDTSRLLLLAIMAGATIGFASAVSNIATHAISNYGLLKLISSMIFPFGLITIMLTGTELFTGNIMISISVANKQTTIVKMLRNWLLVYLGNFIGATLIAGGLVYIGQLNASHGQLAIYCLQMAISKSQMPFGAALVSGIFCNLLVCTAVLLFFSSTNTVGQILACFIPTAIFVLGGFEHSVANMYYLSVAYFAKTSGLYNSLALTAQLDLSVLTWPRMLINNLLPVTIGNIIGGTIIASSMYLAHSSKVADEAVQPASHAIEKIAK